eukprot:193103-Rhodomonas_salina.1
MVGLGPYKNHVACEEEAALEEHGVEDDGCLVLERCQRRAQALEHVAGERLSVHSTRNAAVTAMHEAQRCRKAI